APEYPHGTPTGWAQRLRGSFQQRGLTAASIGFLCSYDRRPAVSRHPQNPSSGQLPTVFVLGPRVKAPASTPSFHPGPELVRLVGPSEALHQRPGADVGPAEGPGQIPSRQPDAVSGVHVELFVMPSGVDHRVADCELTHVPDALARIPHPPGELDAFMGVPEWSGPSTALVEVPSLQADRAFPHREHVRRVIGR